MILSCFNQISNGVFDFGKPQFIFEKAALVQQIMEHTANVRSESAVISTAIEVDQSETGCKDKVKKCGNGCWLRSKVVINGLLAFTAISGIWTTLSNIVSLQVYPTIRIWHSEFMDGVQFHEGILCTPSTAFYDQEDIDFCYNIAEQMANQTSSHSEWDCRDLVHGVNLVEDTRFGVQGRFIRAMVWIGIAVFYSIIHDCALIHYHGKRGLRDFDFWPSRTLAEDFPATKRMVLLNDYVHDACCKRLKGEWKQNRGCCLVLCPFLSVLAYLAAAIFGLGILTMFVLDLFVFNLLCCGLVHRRKFGECCRAIAEVSACGVGVARVIVVFYACFFVGYAIGKIPYPIEEPISNECECYCNYALHTWDAFVYVIAVSTLAVANLLFLNSWKSEVEFRRFHFYLLTYTVPTVCLDALSESDLMPKMIRSPEDMHSEYQQKVETKPDFIGNHGVELAVSTTIKVGDVRVTIDAGDTTNVIDEIKYDVHGTTDAEAGKSSEEVVVQSEPNKEDESSANPECFDWESKHLRHRLFELAVYCTGLIIFMSPAVIAGYRLQAFWGWPKKERYIVYWVSGVGTLIWMIGTSIFVARNVFEQWQRKKGDDKEE